MEIGKEQIKEYLEKYNIKNKEDLTSHIEELKRNTIPNTKLISELVYVLEDDYFFRAPHTMEDFLSFPKLKNDGIKQNVEREKSTWKFLKPMFEEVHVHKQTINGVESYSKPLYEKPNIYEDTKNAVKDYMSNLENKYENQEDIAYDYTEGDSDNTEVVVWVNKTTGKEEKIRIYKDISINTYPYHRPTFILLELDKNQKRGKKTNSLKPQMSLLFKQFPKALEAVVLCSQYGHEKYKETDEDYLNYTRVDGGNKTYADAGLRHRLEQGNDLESGLPHQFHVAWNALAELELWIKENK